MSKDLKLCSSDLDVLSLVALLYKQDFDIKMTKKQENNPNDR